MCPSTQKTLLKHTTHTVKENNRGLFLPLYNLDQSIKDSETLLCWSGRGESYRIIWTLMFESRNPKQEARWSEGADRSTPSVVTLIFECLIPSSMSALFQNFQFHICVMLQHCVGGDESSLSETHNRKVLRPWPKAAFVCF